MEHMLHVTIGQDLPLEVKAEMNLVNFPVNAHPDSIEGQILGLSKQELLRLSPTSGEAVIVTIRGKRYRFATLGSDGAFTLCKDWE